MSTHDLTWRLLEAAGHPTELINKAFVNYWLARGYTPELIVAMAGPLRMRAKGAL